MVAPTFKWDEIKAERSPKAHESVTFEEAATVFSDSHAIEFFDALHSEEEDRFLRIGASLKGRILLVVFCERRGNVIWIISTQKTTPKEIKAYEKGI
jgi:uncharacterized DUF497 family protein